MSEQSQKVQHGVSSPILRSVARALDSIGKAEGAVSGAVGKLLEHAAPFASGLASEGFGPAFDSAWDDVVGMLSGGLSESSLPVYKSHFRGIVHGYVAAPKKAARIVATFGTMVDGKRVGIGAVGRACREAATGKTSGKGRKAGAASDAEKAAKALKAAIARVLENGGADAVWAVLAEAGLSVAPKGKARK